MVYGARALFLSAIIVFAAGPAAFAQDDSAAVRANQAKLGLARQLVDYGKANKDALALVTGVRMMTSVKGTILADGEKGKEGKQLDLSAILDEAEGYAKDSEATLSLIRETREMVSKAPKERALCYWQWYCDWSGCYYAWICF